MNKQQLLKQLETEKNDLIAKLTELVEERFAKMKKNIEGAEFTEKEAEKPKEKSKKATEKPKKAEEKTKKVENKSKKVVVEEKEESEEEVSSDRPKCPDNLPKMGVKDLRAFVEKYKVPMTEKGKNQDGSQSVTQLRAAVKAFCAGGAAPKGKASETKKKDEEPKKKVVKGKSKKSDEEATSDEEVEAPKKKNEPKKGKGKTQKTKESDEEKEEPKETKKGKSKTKESDEEEPKETKKGKKTKDTEEPTTKPKQLKVVEDPKTGLRIDENNFIYDVTTQTVVGKLVDGKVEHLTKKDIATLKAERIKMYHEEKEVDVLKGDELNTFLFPPSEKDDEETISMELPGKSGDDGEATEKEESLTFDEKDKPEDGEDTNFKFNEEGKLEEEDVVTKTTKAIKGTFSTDKKATEEQFRKYREAQNTGKFSGEKEAIEYLRFEPEIVKYIIKNWKELEEKYPKTESDKPKPKPLSIKPTGRVGAKITNGGKRQVNIA